MQTLSTDNRLALPRTGLSWRWLLALCAGVIFSILGVKTFEPWSQVTLLWEAQVSPILLVGHPHFLRFLAVYPGFMLEDRWMGVGFSIYISFFLAHNVVLWRQISLISLQRAPTAGAWFIFLVAHFFMNGRGVIAWSAWLLCIWLCLRMTRGATLGFKHLFLVALSFWFAAVSTGVFIVVAAVFGIFHFQHLSNIRWTFSRIAITAALAGPLLFKVSEHFIVALDKNIAFYGGGWNGAMHVMNHGFGKIFISSDFMLAVLVFIVGLICFLAFLLYFSGKSIAPLTKMLLISIAGGLFGFTVLTLTIPLVLLRFSSGVRPQN